MDQEYVLLEADSAYSLSSSVNRYLKDGWSLHGGPALGGKEYAVKYAQALIRIKPHVGDPGWR